MPAILSPEQIAAMDETIEAAYWQFDARRSGDGAWKGVPMAERDAFKASVRMLLARGDASNEPRYYIASYHHGLNARAYIQWWAPESKGYTPDLATAGIYSRDEALKIDRGELNAIAIPVDMIERFRIRHMLDIGDFANDPFRSHARLRRFLAECAEAA